MSLHSFRSGPVEILYSVFWLFGKSKNAARPVELIDACWLSFTERKCAKFIAVERVHCARNPTRFHGESIKVISDSGRRTDAVQQLIGIAFAIEELFASAVGHENVFPLIGHNHDFEILGARHFNRTDKIFSRRGFTLQHFQNVHSLAQFACTRGLRGNSKKICQADQFIPDSSSRQRCWPTQEERNSASGFKEVLFLPAIMV